MKVGLKEENRYNMNMLVVNGQLYSRSTGARSTTLVPGLQKHLNDIGCKCKAKCTATADRLFLIQELSLYALSSCKLL